MENITGLEIAVVGLNAALFILIFFITVLTAKKGPHKGKQPSIVHGAGYRALATGRYDDAYDLFFQEGNYQKAAESAYREFDFHKEHNTLNTRSYTEKITRCIEAAAKKGTDEKAIQTMKGYTNDIIFGKNVLKVRKKGAALAVKE